jgi:hypothetical protein
MPKVIDYQLKGGTIEVKTDLNEVVEIDTADYAEYAGSPNHFASIILALCHCNMDEWLDNCMRISEYLEWMEMETESETRIVKIK